MSDQCKSYYPENGRCSSCWDSSYEVDEYGVCSKAETSNLSAECNWSDNFCGQFDSQGCCTVCSHRYYFNEDRKCTEVSPDCNNYDAETGNCTSCYWGFHEEDGECNED